MQSHVLTRVKMGCFSLLRWTLRRFRPSQIYSPLVHQLSRCQFIFRIFSVDQLASVFPSKNWNTIKVNNQLNYSFYSLLDDYWSSKLYWLSRANLDYEQEIWEFLASVDLKDGLFMDVGAHTGYWSICLKLANPTLDVCAFEPHPLVFERLIKNISKNNVEIDARPLAIGEQEGFFSFYSQPGIPCSSSLSKGFMLSFSEEASLISYRGSVLTLDAIAEQITKNYRNVIVKLDVEGTEINVLRKSEVFLKRFKPILILEVLSADQHDNINRLLVEQGYSKLVNLRVAEFPNSETPNYISKPN